MSRWLARIICFFRFHELRVVHQLSRYCQKLRCDRCGGYFAVNHQERGFLDWDAEFEAFYCEWLEIPRTNH